ncbi:uncharacterized protein LOC129592793 [Paramacrobiotus metropolitanus]|uniref:uncharacterized protein LOC129592793 n=1 Tax=Paramacrobiotus metropolitanus TaxID=2943436 RepID=UPI0024458934|nr:uncharacterized protein LOC129592793 [Paramacrobiotus metropolitanus]
MDGLKYVSLFLMLFLNGGSFSILLVHGQKIRPHPRDDQSHPKRVQLSRDDDHRYHFAPGRSYSRPDYAVASLEPGHNLYRRRGALSASKPMPDGAMNRLGISGSRKIKEKVSATTQASSGTGGPGRGGDNTLAIDPRPSQSLRGNSLFFPSGRGTLSILVRRPKPLVPDRPVFFRPFWTVPRNNTGIINLTKSSPQTATSLLALFGW